MSSRASDYASGASIKLLDAVEVTAIASEQRPIRRQRDTSDEAVSHTDSQALAFETAADLGRAIRAFAVED
jgi:hypothetical protein